MEEKKQTRKEKQLEKHLEAVVEAVLFTMGKSVELRQLAIATGQSEEETRQAVERLKVRYDKEERGMEIIELEDSYQMCTRTGFYENLIRVAASPKKQVLSEVVLETLSIIAYKQPVTKMEIEKIRGVKSDHAVNRLVEYNLVQEVGRLDARDTQRYLLPQRNFCAVLASALQKICQIWIRFVRKRSVLRWKRK